MVASLIQKVDDVTGIQLNPHSPHPPLAAPIIIYQSRWAREWTYLRIEMDAEPMTTFSLITFGRRTLHLPSELEGLSGANTL